MKISIVELYVLDLRFKRIVNGIMMICEITGISWN